MTFDDTKYFFIKNQQGDVEQIVDRAGGIEVRYTYDAWGKVIEIDDDSFYGISDFNPFLYRSYVYDRETGLYYLQSRYYDPQTGRFLNADNTIFLGVTGTALSCNVFAYCENDCINFRDTLGRWRSPINNDAKCLWLIVVSALYSYGWDFSAYFLDHSLNDNPANLSFYRKSELKIVKEIKKDKDFMKKLRKKVKKIRRGKINNAKFSYKFSGDLGGALHYVNVTCNRCFVNGKHRICVVINDTYDFKWEWVSDNIGFLVGNNLAYISQGANIISSYKIYITFYMKG